MLINGGLSYVVPDLLKQFETFGVDASRIDSILLLHSHFDHIGIAPFFKRRHPGLKIYTSARAAKILKKHEVIQAVNQASQYAIDNSASKDACLDFDLAWDTEIDCVALQEGDQIDLGDMSVEIYATPGHSPCSISAYLPTSKVLFPSDAGGLPWREEIITYGTSDFSTFIRSLKKMVSLDVHYLCSDHYGYVHGDEAAGFMQASVGVAEARRKWITSTYRKTGDIEKTARLAAERFQDEGNFNLVPHEVFVAAQRSIVKHVVRKLKEVSIWKYYFL